MKKSRLCVGGVCRHVVVELLGLCVRNSRKTVWRPAVQGRGSYVGFDRFCHDVWEALYPRNAVNFHKRWANLLTYSLEQSPS